MPPLGIYLSMSLIYESGVFFQEKRISSYIIFRLLENQFFYVYECL